MEESDAEARKELFGDAKLGLLYSGNLGRAHVYRPFVELAKRVEGDSIAFCYAGRGPQMDSLRAEVDAARQSANDAGERAEGTVTGGLTNIVFAGFASEEQLGKRLAAADVHMVSLAPHWTGTVVPSKFFGALAVGRPVLFAGSRNSAIAKWIEEFGVGWVLDARETWKMSPLS